VDPSDRARARSRLFQLLAWGFAYPIPDLVAELQNGGFAGAVADAHRRAFGHGVGLPRCTTDFATWETQYVELFDVGAKGAPAASLCAGDVEELLAGRGRPEFLLEFIRWYSHFGLRLRQEPEVRELPDHLTCQLEFLAWLAHLEAGATPGSESAGGYRLAQLDFCRRCLAPFVSRLAAAVAREVERRGCDRLFAALPDAALAAAHGTVHEIDAPAKKWQ